MAWGGDTSLKSFFFFLFYLLLIIPSSSQPAPPPAPATGGNLERPRMQIWSESATVCLLACRVFNLCPCIPVHLNWQLLGRRRRSPRDFKKTSLIRRRNYRPGGGPLEGSVYCLQSHGCCYLPSDTAQYVEEEKKKSRPHMYYLCICERDQQLSPYSLQHTGVWPIWIEAPTNCIGFVGFLDQPMANMLYISSTLFDASINIK